MYIVITLNHMRAVKAWAEANGGSANLDLLTFQLEIKARNRFFTLYPRFQGKINGQLAHFSQFNDASRGFIGWLPYRPLNWALSTDKLLFKKNLQARGINTPPWWRANAAPTSPYILKRSVGSFGYDIRGPFYPGQGVDPRQLSGLHREDARGEIFSEKFIDGRILKAWFWGATPFHVQVHKRPEITGDGIRTNKQLVAEALGAAGQSFETYSEMAFVESSLALQQLALNSVMAKGQVAWIDFRYGRQFTSESAGTANDNALNAMSPASMEQLLQLGKHLASELKVHLNAPVLYSVDGVIDKDGEIAWLEMNSNPIFPPTGYAHMLNFLFGVSASPDADAATPSAGIAPVSESAPLTAVAQ